MVAGAVQATAALDAQTHHDVCRRTIFECCKWDPQVEDVSVLAPYALILPEATWRELTAAAERLERELTGAEHELLARPELCRRLGLPRAISKSLTHARSACIESGGAAPRVTRYDFHLASEGWRISEANTDVPGGFIEASGFTQMMRDACGDGLVMAGDPGDSLARAISQRDWKRIGLVHATAFTDDRQVMIYLQKRFAEHGLQADLLAPDHVGWHGESNGRGACATAFGRPFDLIVRFYPGEWLPQLPRRSGWWHFVHGSVTPLVNPATALITQSKRFPLVWDELVSQMSTWRAMLPETRDPRRVNWRDRSQWVLKPALGRVGDMIGVEGATTEQDWKLIERSVKWFPSHWIAQRRFDALPIETPDGPRYAALGVFVIDGRAAGIYGRIAPKPLINHRAQDVAVLIQSAAPVRHVLQNEGRFSHALA